jgi:hypothetical protein
LTGVALLTMRMFVLVKSVNTYVNTLMSATVDWPELR